MAQPRIGQKVVVDVPATTANLGPGFDCLGAALDLNNRFAMRRIEAPPKLARPFQFVSRPRPRYSAPLQTTRMRSPRSSTEKPRTVSKTSLPLRISIRSMGFCAEASTRRVTLSPETRTMSPIITSSTGCDPVSGKAFGSLSKSSPPAGNAARTSR